MLASIVVREINRRPKVVAQLFLFSGFSRARPAETNAGTSAIVLIDEFNAGCL